MKLEFDRTSPASLRASMPQPLSPQHSTTDRDAKRALRRLFRAKRALLSAEQRAAAAEKIATHLLERIPQISPELSIVAVYLSTAQEVSLHLFIEDMLRLGTRVVAPRGDGFAELRRMDDLARCERGTELPDGMPVPINETGIFLVPGLAFDASGARLGQGGGWYDRALDQRSANSVCIGAAFEEQIATALPREPHDVQMQFIVTPERWIQCASTVEIEAARPGTKWEQLEP